MWEGQDRKHRSLWNEGKSISCEVAFSHVHFPRSLRRSSFTQVYQTPTTCQIQSLLSPLAKSETLNNLATFTVLICKIGEPLPQNGFLRITDIACEI